MSNSSIVVDNPIQDNPWWRIGRTLLDEAGIVINGKAPEDIRVNNADFFKRVLREGSVGLGESYMDGWWDCDRLDLFFTRILQAGLENKIPHHLKDILRILSARVFNLQTRKRAWIVGKEHYDLGNDLFTRMLDPFMQYSCGYWKEATDLQSAQQAKLHMICEKLHLQPGMRLLDIGCGWGGLAEFAARFYGVSVTGVTIFPGNNRPWRRPGAKGWTLTFCCRITAICMSSLTVLFLWECLSMSARKTMPSISMWWTET